MSSVIESQQNSTSIEAHIVNNNMDISSNANNSNIQLASASPTGDQHGESKETGSEILELLSELGDHPGIILGPYHVADLPIIIYEDGLHIYGSPASMEAEGLFTMHHGHPVKSSDHTAPALDLSPTNLIFFQWVAMLILVVGFVSVAGKYKKNPKKAPSGLQNIVESLVLFVRDDIVKPNIPTKRASNYLLPYFLTLFSFILVMNVLGLIPFGHTATGTVAVAAGLAITAFIVIQFSAIRESGIGAWFHHLLGGAPWWLFPLMVPIEILSLFIKPFALTIRLFANMTAGHIILFALLGLLFMFKILALAPVITVFSLFMYLLELLVAFLQAFIFTMLTAIFVGIAIGDHHHEAQHEAH